MEEEGALTGYRVLDLADAKGAYCTKLLADLGAEVIKVECPQGDPTRGLPPFAEDIPDLERSLPFLFRNANKLGITLNLETEDGKRLLGRLVESADVLVESFTNLRLDYGSLSEINPALIMASITEFGQSGPYRDWRGSPIVDLALSTVLIEAGFPDKAPCSVPGMPAYDATSVMAAISIVLALFERGGSSEGHYIDVSVHENARLAIYPWMVTLHSYNRSPAGPPPPLERRMGAAVYPVYPCKDGYIRVVALTPWQWDALLEVLGRPEALAGAEWRELVHRISHAAELYDIVVEFTKNYTMMELFETGHQAGVPIAPILGLSDFVDSPQTRAREFFLDMQHPVIGEFRYPGPPYKWTETPCRVERPAPCLGEHNIAILCERLGLSRTELAALRCAGVV
ncbi:MAG: CoA transferase [Deltaproteobacteria bacterium]|nr:CoA transferase [Deltaproteobacteria bacterium]